MFGKYFRGLTGKMPVLVHHTESLSWGLLVASRCLANEIADTKENASDSSNLQSNEERCSFLHVGSEMQANFIIIILGCIIECV
jgi:hypothetical protein